MGRVADRKTRILRLVHFSVGKKEESFNDAMATPVNLSEIKQKPCTFKKEKKKKKQIGRAPVRNPGTL